MHHARTPSPPLTRHAPRAHSLPSPYAACTTRARSREQVCNQAELADMRLLIIRDALFDFSKTKVAAAAKFI
jgi:hypothetical protein